jgi:predicted PurR-regulated permease PerM
MADPDPLLAEADDVMSVRGVSATIVAIVAAIFVLHTAATLIVPLLVSVLGAYALEPVVSMLMRVRVPRVVAAAVTYLVLAIVVGSGIRAAHEQVASFAADLPAAVRALSRSIGAMGAGTQGGLLDQLEAEVRRLQARLDPAPRSGAPPAGASRARGTGVVRVTPVYKNFSARALLESAGSMAFVFTGRMLVIVLLTFLFLATGDILARKVVALGGVSRAGRRVSVDVIRTINRQIQRYLVARLLISIIVAVATGVGLWAIGLAHALVWGIIAGALNLFPLIGPTCAVAMIGFAAFVQFRSIELTALAAGIATAVAAIEGNLITPWLLGRAGDLNTVAVFVSILFWGWMWDAWGLLLAVPIMVTIKAAADHIDPLRPMSELLGR